MRCTEVGPEYVIDEHVLKWTEAGHSDGAFVGDAVPKVGLREPTSGARLLTPRGDGQLVLASTLVVR